MIRQKKANDPAAVQRFLREVRALGAISHPHVVACSGCRLEDGRLYYAMEYVPGTDLGRLLLERGALPIEVACRYVARIGKTALAYLIARSGSSRREAREHPGDGGWIFGQARRSRFGSVRSSGLGRSGERPDASRHDDRDAGLCGPRSKSAIRVGPISAPISTVWAARFYHMLTGLVPFSGHDTMAKMYMHQSGEPIPLENFDPMFPPAIVAVVRKLMAKKPRDRYQDPGEVAATLRPYLLAVGETLTDAAAPTAPGIPIVLAGMEPRLEPMRSRLIACHS